MPCPGCDTRTEPALRKPRPYSAEWERDRSTYFGCPACGMLLARLSGPAVNRPPDVPSDRLPDPEGLVSRRIQPVLDKTPREDQARVMETILEEVAREQGLGLRSPGPGRSESDPALVFTLLWRAEPWLTLGLREGRAGILEGS